MRIQRHFEFQRPLQKSNRRAPEQIREISHCKPLVRQNANRSRANYKSFMKYSPVKMVKNTKRHKFFTHKIRFRFDLLHQQKPVAKSDGLLFMHAHFSGGSMGEKNCVSSFVCLRM